MVGAGSVGASGGGALSWDDAVATRSFSAIEAWYAANTGYHALGLTEGELIAGSLTPTAQGQLIFGRRGTSSRPAVSDVTIRGCLFEWSPSLYAAYTNPTFGAPYTDIVFEYCTFIGPAEAPDTARRAGVISGQSGNCMTFRNCDFSGGTSCLTMQRGAIMEYCWVHDLAAATAENGAHRTSGVITGSDNVVYRNYMTDGGSSCLSIYFDQNPMNNITATENILNGSSPHASPSYLINMKNGDHGPGATDVKILGNYFGPEYQFGIMTGANVPWGTAGNERTGNQHFLTGELVANT